MNKIIRSTRFLTPVFLIFMYSISETPAKLNGATLSFLPGQGTVPQIRGMQTQVMPGQRFSTRTDEIREILFPDGTALTLGPNSEALVEAYEYDDTSRVGKMVLRIEKGMLRLVGGVINNNQTIRVKTPTSDILLTNASTILEVRDDRTRAVLLYGQALTMTNTVDSQSLVRPEFEVMSTSTSEPLEGPQRQSSESAAAYLSSLSTRKWVSYQAGPVVDTGTSEAGVKFLALATEDQPEGQRATPTNPETPVTSNDPGNTGDMDNSGNPNNPTNPVTGNPELPPLSLPDRPTAIDSALDASVGFRFSVGDLLGAANTDGEQATVTNTPLRNLTQNRVPYSSGKQDVSRDPGPTTNRILNSKQPFTQVVDTAGESKPSQAIDKKSGNSTNLQYVFESRSISLDTRGDEVYIDYIGINDNVPTGTFSAPFRLPGEAISSESGTVMPISVAASAKEGTLHASVFGDAIYEVLQNGFSMIDFDNTKLNQDGTHPDFRGTLWEKVKFNTELPFGISVGVRQKDNFLLIQARPATTDKTRRDEIKDSGKFQILNDNSVSYADDFDPIIFLEEPRMAFVVDLFSNDFFGEDLGDENNKNTIVAGIKDDTKKVDAIAKVLLAEGDIEDGLKVLLDKKLLNVDERNIVLKYADSPGENTDFFTVDTNRFERFLFAAGDIDGSQAPLTEREVHQFFLSAGLSNFKDKASRTAASDIRAFLRTETAPGLNLHDSGLSIVYPRSNASADSQNALLHADFGLQGTHQAQRSSISVTLGELLEDESTGVRHALVTGSTLASSRDNRERDTVTNLAKASVLATSPVFSTSSGGGNPDLDRLGRAGYIVLENFDPEAENSGGLEQPLDITDNETRYAFLRLATATGAQEVETGASETYQGWAAGLAESQNNASDKVGINQIDSDLNPDNVVIRKAPETNRMAAQLNLTTDGLNFKSYAFGGLTGEDTRGASAYIDDDRFAARTVADQEAELALVSGDLVKSGLPAEMQTPVRDYQYLKWGFFFGDTITTENTRQHVHLGSWAAGRIADPGNFPSTGTATYSGHAIGNVFNNGSLYTAVGTYENAWNFGTRAGTVAMDFDGANLTGQTRLRDNSVVFDGVISADQRVGGLHGNFVQGGGDPAAGVAGRFSIQETAGAAQQYRASGTFAAEK